MPANIKDCGLSSSSRDKVCTCKTYAHESKEYLDLFSYIDDVRPMTYLEILTWRAKLSLPSPPIGGE